MDKEAAQQDTLIHSLRCTCLNCGSYCTGKFCPECGQPTSTPARLNSKTFGKTFMTSVTRLSPGLFITTWTLLTRPWIVIRDYLHGKHTKFTPPFTLAIQIFFLCAIIEAILSEFFIPSFEAGIQATATGDRSLLTKFLTSSQLARYILFTVPLSLSVFIAFIPFGSRKFNIYEYTCASLYMTIPIAIFAVIINLFQRSDIQFWLEGLMIFLGCYWIWGNIVLFKVFKIRKLWQRIIMFFWFNIILMAVIWLFSELLHAVSAM